MRRLLPGLLLVATGASAEPIEVRPEQGPAALSRAIESAPEGAVVRVLGGSWSGPLVVDRRLELVGEGWPVIDGGGRGTVVDLRAAGTSMRGFVVRASGRSLDEENSGIAVQAADVVVEGNRLDEVLFGVYLRQASGGVVRGNEIRGLDLELPRRGDAIRVWYSNGVRLADNRVSRSRDVVLWYSDDLDIRGNTIESGRYGLHFMYCDDARIEGNRISDNSVGAFLMYSRRLRLVGNTISGNHGPSGYGVGLKDMDDAIVSDNYIAGNRVGIFLDNSPREIGSSSEVAGNLLVANDFGALLLPNVRRGAFHGNGFVENQEQVGISGPGGDPAANEWRGNYWSDYAGYDADGDRVGDLPYRSEWLFESLATAGPELRLFLYSPASEALDFASRAFPLVRPRPKLTDPAPSLDPPRLDPLTSGVDASGVSLTRMAIGMLIASVGLLALGPWLASRHRGRAHPPLEDGGMIRVEGLTKRFGATVALDDVTFSIAPGESVALWGPNGAGKTTAIRALMGVVSYEGAVRIDGFDPLRDGKELRRRVGFIPQEIPLASGMSVTETIDFYARLRRCDEARCERLLADLGLTEHAGKSVKHLSGGLRQRLALAVALVADPPVLLLDEPSANLDEGARRAFLAVLRRFRGDKTLIFSSHRYEEVLELADRVLLLEGGKLVGSGPPAELLGGRTTSRELRVLAGGAEIEGGGRGMA